MLWYTALGHTPADTLITIRGTPAAHPLGQNNNIFAHSLQSFCGYYTPFQATADIGHSTRPAEWNCARQTEEKTNAP